MALRILTLAEGLPRPDFNSGDRRFVALLEILGRQHRVDLFLSYAFDMEEKGARATCTRLERAGVRIVGSGWSALVNAAARRFYHVALFEFFRTFEEYAWLIRQRQPGAVLVVDSVDVHFAREAAGEQLGIRSESTSAVTRARELAVYRAADAVIAVTDGDADILRREGAMPHISVVPNVMQTRVRSDRSRKPVVLFVGGFLHRPNVDAVHWFVTEVWPHVRRNVPEAVFEVVGSAPPPEILSLAAPGVRVLGYVPDTAAALDEASVSIAPLRYGAGMKGKVTEAMACGIPVVTTRVGIQGIPVMPGVHAAVADSADDFARAVVQLLNNPNASRTMGAAGQDLARRYTPDRVAQVVDAMLAQLVREPHALAPRLRWLGAQATLLFRILKRVAGFSTTTNGPANP